MMTFEGHVNRLLLFVWVESRLIFNRCIGQHSVSSGNYVHYVVLQVHVFVVTALLALKTQC